MSLFGWLKRTPEGEEAPEPKETDECPYGGAHERVEIRSATQHEGPILIYCKRCRQELQPKAGGGS